MEAPLGASALMHSSTLVIAGLVLIYKFNFILEFSIYGQILMYIMGVLTAFLGSLYACFQFELKVIMAYSTISNMGYLFILCSLMSYNTMLLVLIMHAYIKIFLFLIVGLIMFQCNGCQDLRYFGFILPFSPFLYLFYFIGSFTLLGFPYFSGYYYKFFLWKDVTSSFSYVTFGKYLVILSFIFTFIYVFRSIILIFANVKTGHHSVYKLKVYPLVFIGNFIALSALIIFNSYFWINYLDLAGLNLNISLVSVIKKFYYYQVSDLSYISYYM
jgi:NADH:ubiquinone oxidoreductase subunit 5 (subunit L)/multisubunit Na+/H+ antiporter MnhA subunit